MSCGSGNHSYQGPLSTNGVFWLVALQLQEGTPKYPVAANRFNFQRGLNLIKDAFIFII